MIKNQEGTYKSALRWSNIEARDDQKEIILALTCILCPNLLLQGDVIKSQVEVQVQVKKCI